MGRFTTEQVEAAVLAHFTRTYGMGKTTDALNEVFVDSAAVRDMLIDRFEGMDGSVLGALALGIAIGADLRAAPGLQEAA